MKAMSVSVKFMMARPTTQAFDPSSAPIAIEEFDGPSDTLIAQQGEKITEQERIVPARIFTTPAGETVIDFGQKLPVMSKFL